MAFMDWNTPGPGGVPGSAPYRDFTPFTQAYYEQNPTQGYSQYLTRAFGTQQTPLAQYAAQQYGHNFANYLQASEGDPTMHWTDYLTGDLGKRMQQAFQMQTPNTKGYALGWLPSGRYTG